MKQFSKLVGVLGLCATLLPLQVRATPGYTHLTILLADEMPALEVNPRIQGGHNPLLELRRELPGMKPLVDLARTRNTEELRALQRHRLTRYYEVDTSNLDKEQAEALLAEIRTNPVVEAADFEPVIDGMNMDNGEIVVQAERANIPDYTSKQNYLQGRTAIPPYKIGGVNAVEAWSVPGGKGDGIRVISSEIDHWEYDHIDLPKPYFEIPGNSKPGSHDTGSVGTIASQENGFGTTGISPSVQLGYVKYGIDNLLQATAHLQAGNVLQIGVHYLYSNLSGAGCASSCYMPVEANRSIRDVIAYLTMEKGVHVVLAAANGNINLDHPYFKGEYDRNLFDSGAIYAGAVDPKTGLKASFSEYGSRVDLFGWGYNVTTTTLDPSNPTTGYTHTFSGTSSANPIIAGVVASLQGVARAHHLGHVPPKTLRKILVETGCPEINGTSTRIGVQPDLEAATKKLLDDNIGRPPSGRLAVPEEVKSGETFSVHVYAESPDEKPLTFVWKTIGFDPATGVAEVTESRLLKAPIVASDTRTSLSVDVSDGQHKITLTENLTVKAENPPENDCAPPWIASKAYSTAGEKVSYDGYNYEVAHWTQNNRPDLNFVETGSAKPWRRLGTCGGPQPVRPPEGSLEGNDTVESGKTITFVANVRSPDNYPLSYSWTRPAGFSGTIGNDSSVTLAAPAVTADITGTVSVEVSDDRGGRLALSKPVTVKVGSGGGNACAVPWVASQAYATPGEKVSYDGYNYEVAHWTQNNRPDLNFVETGSAKPWRRLGPCGGAQ
ncbi:S8 family peptidase [Burkholderia pyrrocinia]|uniref:S8 family peptidase n=1 Tax=Burkholderia pyrrocinia TaxID=60550 RepID=UPI00158A3EA9|nr:S8 family serine peptidase [Burkholderia pyrrocinia]